MKMRAVLLTAGLLLCWTTQVSARPNPYLEKGIRLLGDMEDQRALGELQRALSVPGLTKKEKARIHLYLGIAHFNLMRTEAAKKSFLRAVELDPEAQLPEMTSPKIRVFFAKLRRRPTGEANPAAEVTSPGLNELGQAPHAPASGPAVAASAGTSDRGVPLEPGVRRRINWPAWVTLGVGVLAAGGGLTFALLCRSKNEEATSAIDRTAWPQAEAASDAASSYALGANVSFGIAGAAAIASGVLFYLGRAKPSRPSAAVAPLPGGAMVNVGLTGW
jgi:hypothetical protein